MSNGKGKARSPIQNLQEDHVQPSLASRIGNSASSLAHDIFNSTAASSSATSDLASSMSSREKGQSRSGASSSSPWAQDGPSKALTGQAVKLPESFRSRGSLGTVYSAADFDYPGDSTSWTNQFKSLRDSYEQPRGEAAYLVSQLQSRLQQPNDGAEVVTLLNDVTFSTNEEALNEQLAVERHMTDTTAEDLFGEEALTASERDIAGRMRGAFSLENQVQNLHGNPDDFARPQVESIVDGLAASQDFQFDEALLVAWADAWEDVLHRYVDDVWGFNEIEMHIRQTNEEKRKVQEAQALLDETKRKNEWWKDGQAVRRLAMVLGHLSVSKNETGVQSDENTLPTNGLSQGARPTFDNGTANFKCPDCNGLYGTDSHLAVHQSWLAERQLSANWVGRTKVEEEMRRLQRLLYTGPKR